MWQNLKEIISKRPFLIKIAKKREKEKLLKDFLKRKKINSVSFRIIDSKIYFYCPDHSTLNFLKLNEEEIRKIIFAKEELSLFQYFLKKD